MKNREVARARRHAFTLIEIAFMLAVVIVFAVVFLSEFVGHADRDRVSRAKADMRSLATAIESYMIDANVYFACAKGDDGVNAHLPQDSPARDIWTFRRPASGGEKIMTITTPIAYMSAIPSDPFSKGHKAKFGYYNHKDQGWIMWSTGPDRDYDLDPKAVYGPIAEGDEDLSSLFLVTYDPTNGTKSDGDVWRILPPEGVRDAAEKRCNRLYDPTNGTGRDWPTLEERKS